MEDINNKQQISPEQKTPEKKRSAGCCGNRGYNFGNLFLGLIVVSVGIFYLSKNYGWLPQDVNMEIVRLWPVLIIAAGLSLLDGRGFLSKTSGFLIFLAVIAATSFIVFYGFKNKTEPVLTETPFRIEMAEKTNYSDITIKSGIGKVKISGASELLAEGNFRSNIERLKIGNDMSGERQKLSLEAESNNRMNSLGNIRNDLEVKLNSALPTDIELDLGVSDSDLDLRNVEVNNLNIQIGVSNLRLQLGDRAANAKVNLKSGLSSIQVSLPENVGSKVFIKEGLSSKQINGLKLISDGVYQTENFDLAEKKIEMNFDTGLSSLEIGTYKP